MTLQLVTDLRLPVLWDGQRVDWTMTEPLEGQLFICPPPKEREACPGCGLRAEPVAWRGLVHPLEGATFRISSPTPKRPHREVDVPAWPVIALYAWRCPNCRVDEVWDLRTNETWTLGPEDYGPDGSTAPTPAGQGRLF